MPRQTKVTHYRHWRIYLNPCNIDARVDWLFAHEDYDGPEDSRRGFGPSPEDCMRQIDELEEESQS